MSHMMETKVDIFGNKTFYICNYELIQYRNTLKKFISGKDFRQSDAA